VFEAFFSLMGFMKCADDTLEPGIEKIAIYGNHEGPQHVARQLSSGRWTSKFSDKLDAEHTTPDVVTCPTYGGVIRYMKRFFDGMPPKLPPLHPPPARLITVHGGPLVR